MAKKLPEIHYGWNERDKPHRYYLSFRLELEHLVALVSAIVYGSRLGPNRLFPSCNAQEQATLQKALQEVMDNLESFIYKLESIRKP